MSVTSSRYHLEQISTQLGDDVGVFVCSSSYEERSLSIGLRIQPDSVEYAIILENTDVREVCTNADRLSDHFGVRARRVEVQTENPIQSVQSMYSALEPIVRVRGQDCVVVDITTFTHEQLLILLGLLRRLGAKTVHCLYSGAAAYMTGEKQWLSEGIADIRSVLGFSGELGIGLGSKLIVLVGFEWERAQRVIEAYDPVQLALGIGRQVDAIEDVHFQANKVFFQKLVNLYPHATSFEFSCNDPDVTARVVMEQCSDASLRSVVAPMNTKISTVGVALAGFADPRIQICYAQAAIYNCVSYSTPGEFFRSFTIDLT